MAKTVDEILEEYCDAVIKQRAGVKTAKADLKELLLSHAVEIPTTPVDQYGYPEGGIQRIHSVIPVSAINEIFKEE